MKSLILAALLLSFSGLTGLAEVPVGTPDSPPQNPSSGGEFSLYFDAPAVAEQGSTVTVRSLLTNTGGPLAGWSIVICDQLHTDAYQIIGARSGDVVNYGNGGSPVSFSNTELCPENGVLQGVVVDFSTNNALQNGVGHELIVMDVTLQAPAGSLATLEYCSSGICFSESRETLLVHTAGVETYPTELHEAVIEISEEIPPTGEEFSLYFDAPASAEEGSTVTVRSMLNNTGGPLSGWSILICDQGETDSYQIVGSQFGEAVITGNGGAHASFSHTAVCADNGLRQGVVIDFSGLNPLPSATAHELLVMDVKLTAPANFIATMQYCRFGNCFPHSMDETLLVHPGSAVVTKTRLYDTIVEITESTDSPFIRGDVNGNFAIDLGDPLTLLDILMGNARISCDRAADFDDDGVIDLSDVTQFLGYLFAESAAPPSPGPDCGFDDTPDPLDCESFNAC